MKLKRGFLITTAMLLLSLSPGYAEEESPVDYPLTEEMPGYSDADTELDYSIGNKDVKNMFTNPAVRETMERMKNEKDDAGPKKSFGTPVRKPYRKLSPGSHSIGYKTVYEALEDLKKKPDVTIRQEKGWTIINQQVGETQYVWSFAPHWHKAYPAVARRELVEEDGVLNPITSVMCHAEIPSLCDEFLYEFRSLNHKALNQVREMNRSTDPQPFMDRKEPDTRPSVACKPGASVNNCDEIKSILQK